MDDEKYFLLSNQLIPTNLGYYSSEKRLTSPEARFKRTQKFEQKLLVSIAISTNGISSPFFAKQPQTINEKTYLEECIIKRLVPFIDRVREPNSVGKKKRPKKIVYNSSSQQCTEPNFSFWNRTNISLSIDV